MATLTARVHAPELEGSGGWINTAEPLSLTQLRGRAVILDFWTFCCINCLRVIEELRPLEERFRDRLVVIGVHSPKFPHENDHAAVERAVRRHRIRHPVLDDPDLVTWQRYGVRAWPTLVVIGPGGHVIAQAAGEGSADALGGVVAAALEGRDAPTGPAFTPATVSEHHALSFPGKVASDGGSRIAIADTGNDRVLICNRDGRVLRVIGGLRQPQGVRFDGGRLLVCDTVGGRVIAVEIDDGTRTTLAAGLRSPWDVAVLPDGRIAVAEAGLHRLVAIRSDDGDPSVLAGTRAEG
ncbi:MAG: thioredoxin-like domain-containing protein, partial [Candidatus Dormibacteria bacterium]